MLGDRQILDTMLPTYDTYYSHTYKSSIYSNPWPFFCIETVGSLLVVEKEGELFGVPIVSFHNTG
jgi:hypothetical protein